MSKYDDMIDMSRPISKRPRMSIEMRASQFAPFSALTGYEDAIKEIGRVVDNKRELSDGLKEIINERLNYIRTNKCCDIFSITYFSKDCMKNGGSYITVLDSIKKIDTNTMKIILGDGLKIGFDDIYSIDGDIFNFDM